MTAECIEDVSCLNCLASLTPGTLHCPLEQVGGIGSDPEAFANVLLPAVAEPFFDGHLHDHRIQRQVTHRGVEHIRLFHCQSLEDVFDGDKILVASPRFVQRVFQNALSTVGKFIFV